MVSMSIPHLGIILLLAVATQSKMRSASLFIPQYLELCNKLIMSGAEKLDKEGTKIYSQFGQQLRFDLRHSFPLLTTSETLNMKGVIEEVLRFIRQCSCKSDEPNPPEVVVKRQKCGVQSQQYNQDNSNTGVDQLKEAIYCIKNNPTSHKINITGWNPAALEQQSLQHKYPIAQFYVDHDELSCHLYQRSADMGLGVPFNIASYALLTEILAAKCGLKSGDFVHTIGDAHVYSNHVDALQKQCQNQPRAFPTLKILNYDKDTDKLEDLSLSNFELQGYEPHKTIKMDMAE